MVEQTPSEFHVCAGGSMMEYETKITVHFTPKEIAYLQYVLAHFDPGEIEIQHFYREVSDNLCDDISNIIQDFNVPIGFPKKEASL